MVSTIAERTTQVTIEEPVINIDQRTIVLRWNEQSNRTTLSAITNALVAIDGVYYAEEFRDGSVRIVLIPQNADLEEVARIAVYTVRDILTQSSAPISVKTRLAPNGNYTTLMTDYRHTDQYLLQALARVGLQGAGFSAGGYNIEFRTKNEEFRSLTRRIRRVINGFYAGKFPKQPLYYERTDEQQDTQFELLFNRRIPNDKQRELLDLLEAEVQGLYSIGFDLNGHQISGRAANELFSKNRIASAVAIIAEDFYKTLSKVAD